MTRVLVVDDNHDAADALAVLLQALGYAADTAYDGAHALQRARQVKPHVVLVDIVLPDMDGYQLGQTLRQEMPAARIIAVSGLGRDEDRRRSLDASFDEHLVKPVDLTALQRALGTPKP